MKKKVVILGGGESGVGAALLALQKGYDVFLSDGSSLKGSYRNELVEAGIHFEENGQGTEVIPEADIVIKSPGIPESNEWVKAYRKAGTEVIGEIEWAYRFKGGSRIIAVTGSNGKTTTATLTHHIIKNGGVDCALAGNTGYSFARQLVTSPKPVYVLEVSSFQLDDCVEFRPWISILTNITADHLDRYDHKIENYISSKFRITMNQRREDHFIYCADDEVTMKYLEKAGQTGLTPKPNQIPFSMKKELPMGAFIKDGDMYLRTGQDVISMSIYDFALKGKHNAYNTMAACLAASLMDIRKEKIREAVKNFHSLEHRMEYVATVRGIEFINDSKATNVNSTWYALESMDKPTVLILGGIDKGNDYSLLDELVKEKVKAIVCLGKDNRKIYEAFGKLVPTIVQTVSTSEAVRASFHFAEKGDTVLLSPACASFDLFRNYEDRGRQFKQAVKEL
jgi:UDP-N-acetylmuramoylalanine--D-glutamate ligase